MLLLLLLLPLLLHAARTMHCSFCSLPPVCITFSSRHLWAGFILPDRLALADGTTQAAMRAQAVALSPDPGLISRQTIVPQVGSPQRPTAAAESGCAECDALREQVARLSTLLAAEAAAHRGPDHGEAGDQAAEGDASGATRGAPSGESGRRNGGVLCRRRGRGCG